jgi:hypothetical protein
LTILELAPPEAGAKLIKALEDSKRIETGLLPPLEWSASYHGGPLKFGYVLQGW